MNKAELIKEVSSRSGLTLVDAGKFLNTFVEVIEEEVKNNNTVQITGFGSFLSRVRSSREGKNPRTGEKITIPAQKTPAFKAGKNFKELLK